MRLKFLVPKVEFALIFIFVSFIANGLIALLLLFNIQKTGDRQRATAVFLEQVYKYELSFQSQVDLYTEALFVNNTQYIRDNFRSVIVDDLWNKGDVLDSAEQTNFRNSLSQRYNVALAHFVELTNLARDGESNQARQKWPQFYPDFDQVLLLLRQREDSLKTEQQAGNQEIKDNIFWSVVLLLGLTGFSLIFTILLQILVRRNKKAEGQIKEREQQYRSIFENSSDGLLIFDLETRQIVEANPACYEMYNCNSLKEITALYYSSLQRQDYQTQFYEQLVKIKDQNSKGHFNSLQLFREDKTLYVDLTVTALSYQSKTHLLFVMRDVTEKTLAYQLMEQRVKERTKELATLLEVSHNVASTLELKPLVGLVLDQLKQLVDYDAALILSFEAGTISVLEERSPLPASVLGKLTRLLLQINQGEVENLAQTEPLIIDNLAEQEGLRQSLNHLLENQPLRLVSWLGIPLVVKERLVGFLGLFHRQAGYYSLAQAKLSLAVSNQAAIALENARLYGQAQELAILKERQRLARELHDSTSQVLFSILLGARTTLDLLERHDSAQLVRPLQYIVGLAEGGLDEMRSLIFDLRNNAVTEEGLITALVRQTSALGSRHGISVELELDENEPGIDLNLKNQIYWVLREALNNIIKHSQATAVRLKLCYKKEQEGREVLIIELHDNGVGFDAQAIFPGHFGLQTMRERVAQFEGFLRIESSAGAGTSLYLQVPLAAKRQPGLAQLSSLETRI
jgi:PAS domain S-box-containing protein